MKVDIDTLRDTFKIGYELFEESREESRRVNDYYHNRQYTDRQLAVLEKRGAPKETFNIIKTFSRLLLGYYSTIVNTVKVIPRQQDDIATASILNDLVSYIFNTNNFLSEGEKIKLDLILNGIMCCYIDVEELMETDEFNRPKYKINMSHVPIYELVFDPMSKLDDYSDARFTHRFKWVAEDEMVSLFGEKIKRNKNIIPYQNFTNQQDAEWENFFNHHFVGYSKEYNNYLLVHSVIVDDAGDRWSVYWTNDQILQKDKITYRNLENPYRIYKLHSNNTRAEYYGIFRDIMGTQDAINQALVKIQTMVNTQKVFVEEGAVDDLAKFTDAVNRVNGVIKVKDLQGIRVENLNTEVLQQYEVINTGLNRIQRVLSINDSFLGMAYASDSGAKVKLQQNASMVALRYLTLAIEQFYRLLGWDILCLIQQYMTAHDVIRIADQYSGYKWIEINKPELMPYLQNNGQIVGVPIYEEVRDPASNEPMHDDQGNIILSPIPTKSTDIQFTKADIEVDSVAYNDEEERTRMVMETFISGPLGQMLSAANPAGYFKAGALALRDTKSKYSLDLAQILEDTANSLSQQAQAQMQQGTMPGQEKPKSTENEQTGL